MCLRTKTSVTGKSTELSTYSQTHTWYIKIMSTILYYTLET